ncbi:LysM peptidoglycan-binding domain-containing protein [Micromonospora thermarum]|uniref:LysM peptidoglycan-binding domain-containing protein n=1 Tax=Micromonospora thermarum TaxID=2720024 RepID=A0ABX0Z3X1_9ACTN|nr:LysM peptidoglycan-binding domain-containing protein [Micromonospora thermarum]NJP30773.1 LysM peptidoglycan-binding domain-containing protein [Micromonospora thermarum]
MPQESPDKARRLAEYGARPTVYTPPETARRPRAGRSAARLVRAVVGAVVFLAGVPVLLWVVGGDPLRRLPSWSQVAVWFDQPSGRFTPTVLAGMAVWALWLLWAVFALLLVTELVAVVTRWRVPALRLPAPLHRLVFGLAGTAAIAVTSTGPVHAAVGSDQPTAVAATDSGAVIPRQAVARGPVLIRVADTRYLYTVERHDTLSKIAKEWLGDADRWPEICRLNKHRHFPRTGGTLRDCDLIYPGWDLRLPADARPPTSAAPATPPAAPTPPPATTPPSASPSPTPDAPSPTVPPPTPDHNAAANPSGAPSTAPSAPQPTSPTPPATPSPSASATPSGGPDISDTRSPTVATDEHGVQLSPSDWLPWSLAAAISAAAALVWAQRRRRYTGEPDADPPTQPPPPVLHLRRAVARNPKLPNPESHDTEPPAPVPDLAPLPAGGTGIVGDGAHAAARATLVAVLASGGPHQPHALGEVIIDAATLEQLLGPDAAALNPWPRLHVVDSIDDALTVIEAKLLHRSRILDEHALTDLDTLRQQAPDEEALPPAVLITHTPPAEARMRAKAALALGGDLDVSALLLGEWAHGATIDVAPDGHTTLVSGQTAEPVPPRLPVLEHTTAIQILTTLREAQTGEPCAVASPAAPVTVVPLHASRTDSKPTGQPAPPTTPAADASTGKAQLRVLGQPRIDNITQPGRPLRAKALELAVFLACHPDGATTRDIGEYLEPDARISQADQRVHTNASNLRHVLGRAGTADTRSAYVIKTAGRYRLDPATVDVDVWTLRDLLRTATIATGPRRRELLTAACDLYTAPLADGQDYEWLQPHRETVRRWGTEAHLLLADDLIDSDPQSASDLLDKAIGLDRYNEALYTRAMHARHALGDADGIRTVLRALTKALADLDAEPQEATVSLAHRLRSNLADR